MIKEFSIRAMRLDFDEFGGIKRRGEVKNFVEKPWIFFKNSKIIDKIFLLCNRMTKKFSIRI